MFDGKHCLVRRSIYPADYLPYIIVADEAGLLQHNTRDYISIPSTTKY